MKSISASTTLAAKEMKALLRSLLRRFALSISALGLLSSAHADNSSKEQTTTHWDERAEEAQIAFIKHYWNDERSMFDNQYPCNDCNRTLNYWWLAHAIDVLVDGYERSKDTAYLERANQLYHGIIDKNKGITIDYYDDMIWMGLALLRVYQHTNEPVYRDAVQELWKDIKTGWNEEFGGGIAWRKSQLDYKNTPSNAPAVILAARLHREFGDDADLEWAKRIYRWQKETLIDPETGFAWDGINRRGRGNIDKRWKFTYNQGTYIGASLALFQITEEESYLKEANRTAKAAIDELVISESGMLKREGGRDGGLFKGILVRYLGDFIRLAPEENAAYQKVLEHNAMALWNQAQADKHLFFAPLWSDSAEQPHDMSVQLSGLKLLEQMARF